jgi:hypothetical protein
MSFFNIFKPAPAPASAIAPAVLPPGWQILMSGTKPYYYHAGRNITQPEFPQPEPAPEPERELPAGWKKVIFGDGWVEYRSTMVPGVSQFTFPTAPSRALNPFWEEFKVGDTTMYRSISNRSLVTQEFPEAKPFQIDEMWRNHDTKYNKLAPSHGGKRKQSKRNQSKRNQSKRNQSKRNQSKRKQSNKSH